MSSVSSHSASDLLSARPAARPRGRLVTIAAFLWKFLLGTLFSLSAVTGVVAAGWLVRLMRRAAYRRWFALAEDDRRADTFQSFMARDPETARFVRWPRWVLHETARPVWRGDDAAGEGSRSFARRGLAASFGGLAANLKSGALALINTWVLTLPCCALWLFAWWGGWENSFNKGYEQHWVGPTVFLFGAALFALVMTYLPLALARQAANDNWRAFYDFRLVRALVRRRWLACLGLALLYVAVAAPIMGLKILPMRLDGMIGDFATLTEDQIKDAAGRYYLFATAVLFAGLIVLRLVAARIYAGALLESVRDGEIGPERLGDAERGVMARLGLLRVDPRTRTHPVLKAAKWLGSRTARLVGFGLTLALWGAFVFQLVFAQFLNHVWIGWLNHPLIQIPWLWQGPM